MVFEDIYECEECGNRVRVVDDGHRTAVEYATSTVRCDNCDEDMVRKE